MAHSNLDLGQNQITVTNTFHVSFPLDWLLLEGHWNTVPSRDQPNTKKLSVSVWWIWLTLLTLLSEPPGKPPHNTIETCYHLPCFFSGVTNPGFCNLGFIHLDKSLNSFYVNHWRKARDPCPQTEIMGRIKDTQLSDRVVSWFLVERKSLCQQYLWMIQWGT